MKCDTDDDQQAANDRCLPSVLRRDSNSAGELTRNGEEQKRDARDDQDGGDWRTLQRVKNTFHAAPPAAY